MVNPNFINPLPLSLRTTKGNFSPQLRPAEASANQNTRTNSETTLRASGKRKGKRTKTKTGSPMDYVTPIFMGNGEDSSSSSDSFISEDRRGAYPIDTTRADSVKFSYPVRTVVDTVTDDFLYQDNDQRSTKQHIRLCRFLPSDKNYTSVNASSLVRDQFSNAYDRWTTQIQEVRMNTSMYNFWSVSSVYKYIWLVTRALSIYCCLDSILAIDEPPGEVNRVNTVMKTHFNDTDLLIAQDALRRKLKNQWLPPEMSRLILWTYQLYKTGDNATSMQYRFVPDDGFIRTSTSDNDVSRLITNINDLINDLEAVDPTRIRSILRSSIPSGCINTIPHACNKPTYDPVHHEIWANQVTLWKNSSGNEKVFPTLPADSTGYTIYGMKSNPSGDNGFAFALSQSYQVNKYVDSDIFNTFVHSNASVSFNQGQNEFTAWPSDFNTGVVHWVRNTIENTGAFDEVGNIHLVETNAQTGEAIVAKTVVPLGYQRVYFNSYNQRALVSKELFRNLFSAK